MKKWAAFLLICCLLGIHPFGANNFSQTVVAPQFSELKGMEDQQGYTHLFYRIYESFENPPIYSWSNHIFHLDLETGIDTLFINSSGHEDPIYNFNRWVTDVDYWNNNPAEFIYCGGATSGQFFEGSGYISRYDGFINYFGWFWGSANYIDISLLDDSLLYAGIYTDGGPGILKSLNGGRTWDSLSTDHQFLSIDPFHENIFFVENDNRELFRTTNSGNTFDLVDPEHLSDSRFFYDANGTRIYRVIGNKLKVSNNLGSQNTWHLKYSSNSDIHLFVYRNSPGAAFLGTGKNLFITYNGGDNFELLKTFEYDIVGVHALPDSPYVYIGTKYQIYKWDMINDVVKTIKNIEPPAEYLKWYPLAIGNKWAYEVYAGENGILEFIGYSFDSVVGDTLLQNGFEYFILSRKYLYHNPEFSYLRIDTSEALIYNFDIGLQTDFLYEDLTADLGDIVCYENYIGTFCKFVSQKTQFSKWGVTSWRKDFEPFGTAMLCSHSLIKGLGLYETSCGDFTNLTIQHKLVACIVDGVIYGDTTLVVSVENGQNPIETEFKLEQNYPNPFNPTTSIQYAIGSRQFVTIKVYDVLGNEIATLVNEEKPAGEYEVEFDAVGLPSGVYFYQLKSGSFTETKKMILLR